MDRPVLLATAVTRGRTHVTWQWSHPGTAGRRRAGPVLATVVDVDLLDGAERFAPGEHSDGHVLMDLEDEFAATRRLADVLLPPEIRDALVLALGARERPLLRLLAAPETAALPWELLPLQPEHGPRAPRLIDAVDIRYELPAGVHPGRRRAVAGATGDPVRIVDPIVPGWGTVLTPDDVLRLRDGDPRGRTRMQAHERVRRGDLASALAASPPPSRLVFVGHVHSHAEVGGATALVLSDRSHSYGASAVVRGGVRPLTAVDLIEGTRGSDRRLPLLLAADAQFDAEDLLWPAVPGTAGRDIWPIPPRVLLVGCSSGRDTQLQEPFGLVIALVLGGAEHVTAARWALPTDAWFGGAAAPLVPLIDALDRAHEHDDPVAAACAWQRSCSSAWRATGAASASPVLWSAMTTFHVPPEALRPIGEDPALAARYARATVLPPL